MAILSQLHSIYTLSDLKKVMVARIKQISGLSSKKIYRIELPCKSVNILAWLHNQNAETKVYWSGRDGSFETGGIGIADCIKGDGNVDCEEVFLYMKSRLSEENPRQKYYGGMSFDETNLDVVWKDFGSYQFFVPQFEIVQTKGQTIFAFNSVVDAVSDENIGRALVCLEQINFAAQTKYRDVPQVLARRDFPDRKGWEAIFEDITDENDRIKYNKIVLARKSVFDFNVALRPEALLKHLKDRTPDCFHFCFQPCARTAFLGAAPERLYKRDGRKIFSEAIAGTRPRGKDDEKDKALENQLLNSVKDAQEHDYVVKAIDSGLKPFCDSLTVDENFSLRKLKGSQHLVTQFEGRLTQTARDCEVLEALHPTPAVAGCPTKTAMTVIKDLEPFSRGWYAGPIGYVGYNEAEFAVAIRSGLVEKDKLSLYAGAGIVEGSTVDGEWDEIENKISNFIEVFKR